MRKLIILIFFLGTSRILVAQSTGILVDSLYSSILKEKRSLMVYLPKEFTSKKNSQIKYPVLYVLDGESNYLAITGMVQYLTEVNGNRIFPKMIIVFVSNTNRTRDLTPYKTRASAILPQQMADETGGGETFSRVLENEIIPYIDSKYPTCPYRALVGHSFGGIYALSVLANHPKLFDDYIVLDPSLWYDGGRFSRQILNNLSKARLDDKSLFIGFANTTNEYNLNKVLTNKASFAVHEKNIIRFCRELKQNKTKSIRFNYQYYPLDDHSSVPFIGIYDGLRKFFEDYQLSYYEVINPNFNPEKRIVTYYQNLSKKLKTNWSVSPQDLEYFDMFYNINEDPKGRERLRAFYKKTFPEDYLIFLKANSGQ